MSTFKSKKNDTQGIWRWNIPMDSMAKTPPARRATKVGVHSADLPVLPGSSEEKAGRSPKKTWLVDVVDVLLLGLGCPKKITQLWCCWCLMDIVSNKYVNTWCLLSGLPHRRDPWKINGKTPALMFWCHFYHISEISQSVMLISPKTSYSHHDLPLALDFLPKERH